MANSLDLEEQEQLDQVKFFWRRYGNAITWTLIVALGAFSTWQVWQYWQREQSIGASVLYDEVERAVADKDAHRLERAWTDLKEKFGSTTYAQQGALMAATGLNASGKAELAKSALVWAADQKVDEGLQALARLRLAALALQANTPQEAGKWLEASVAPAFAGLVADRRGDVYVALGQQAEARAAYQQAYQLLDENTEYRLLVEVKLNAMGVNPKAAEKGSVEIATGK